jgi:hypothetical protein
MQPNNIFFFKHSIMSLLSLTLFGCGVLESKSDINSNDLQSSFSCENAEDSSDSGSSFLSKKQLSNTIDDLFGAGAISQLEVALSTLPSESYDVDIRKRTTTVSSEKIQAYFNIAKDTAQYVVSNGARISNVFGACASSVSFDVTCAENYIQNFGVRLLRRPLSTAEAVFIRQLASASQSPVEKMRAVLIYGLQSPSFTMRLELGDGSSGSKLKLSPYETASRIAYTVTDSNPDQDLLTAAKNNQLTTKEQVAIHIKRLLNSPKGREKAVSSVITWSGMNVTKDISSLPDEMIAGLETDGLGDAMVSEARKFIEHIVYNKNGTFKDLLSSKESFAEHPGLSVIYGHSPSVDGQGVLMTSERQGLLMRAPLYTWSSSRSSIIHRGVDFQKKILCNKIPEPNVDIAGDRELDARTAEESLFHTNRSNIAHLTKSPVCMGCHSVINPTGFALEGFDPLGRLRLSESIYAADKTYVRTIDIDTSSQVPSYPDPDIPVSKSKDLFNHVKNSTAGNECFVKNMHRFYNEKKEDTKDGCRLKSAFDSLANQDKPIVDALVDMMISPNLWTKYEESE